MSARSQQGQATIELALLLPVVALLGWILVELGTLATDNVRLWHAAREAARVGVVDPDPAAILEAATASGLRPIEVSVQPGPEERIQGEPLTVGVTYRPSFDAPLIGRIVNGLVLRADATMRIERP